MQHSELNSKVVQRIITWRVCLVMSSGALRCDVIGFVQLKLPSASLPTLESRFRGRRMRVRFRSSSTRIRPSCNENEWYSYSAYDIVCYHSIEQLCLFLRVYGLRDLKLTSPRGFLVFHPHVSAHSSAASSLPVLSSWNQQKQSLVNWKTTVLTAIECCKQTNRSSASCFCEFSSICVSTVLYIRQASAPYSDMISKLAILPAAKYNNGQL